MSEMISLEAHNLTHHYAGRMALSDVSFRLHPGQVVGLLGVNGAGKSTTLNLLAGLLTPQQGQITIMQADLHKQPLVCRKKLGYLPATPPLFSECTVDAYLRHVAQCRAIPKGEIGEKCDQVKTRCGLLEVGKRRIRNLSKGFQQRIGIAQAIIHEPDVIILDEPSVGLDPVQMRSIRTLISELGVDRTVLLSTHILPEVHAVCNRVLMLHQGRLRDDRLISDFSNDGSAHDSSLEARFMQLCLQEDPAAA